MTNKIIFLNGCGSSGKTSIVKAIQQISDERWLNLSVDTFINMLPLNHQEAYFKFIAGSNERGKSMRVEITDKGHEFFSLIPFMASQITALDNLIIDEVILDSSSLKPYATALSKYDVYFIGVMCDLEILQKREHARGDRVIGIANDQIDRVHKDVEYDLSVDTTNQSPEIIATQILKFIENTSMPQAFKKIK